MDKTLHNLHVHCHESDISNLGISLHGDRSIVFACFTYTQMADHCVLEMQPTWSTCSLSSSSSSTSSTSRRLLEDFTQEHLAQRRKLLVDPADQESVISATESLKGELDQWSWHTMQTETSKAGVDIRQVRTDHVW